MDDESSDSVAMMAEMVARSLSVLGYPKPVDVTELTNLVSNVGESFSHFAEIISWLSSELKTQCNLEECVSPISGTEDVGSFRAELNSFLRELRCPYPAVSDYSTDGGDHHSLFFRRLELLNYLCTELQAARLSTRAKVEASVTSERVSPVVVLETMAEALDVNVQISDRASALNSLIAVSDKVKRRLTELPESVLGEPLLTEDLTADQWNAIESLNEKMKVDYRTRAEMLLQRLDVTIQSFSWSDRLKARKQELSAAYTPLREQLDAHSRVAISDLLAARNDLTIVEKAGSANLCSKTQSNWRKLMLVGAGPPDRGGRPKDVLRMPQWRERVVSGGGGPARERRRHKKNDQGKRKPWKDDGASKGPSGSVSMTKRSRKKSKKGVDEGGVEIQDASELN